MNTAIPYTDQMSTPDHRGILAASDALKKSLNAESVEIKTKHNLCSIVVQTKRPINIAQVLANVTSAIVDITGATHPSTVYGNILPGPKDTIKVSFGTFSDLGKDRNL